MKKKIIRSGLILACTLLTTAAYMTAADGPAKSDSAKWQPATIMEVKAHPLVAEEGPPEVGYDVTVLVGNRECTVLYIPPEGTVKEFLEYHVGMEALVLIGTDTMMYNDSLGNTRELGIVSCSTIVAKNREAR